MHTWLQRIWYEGGSLYWILLPLTGIYWLLVRIRKSLYRSGFLKSFRAPVPVIIVGNVTVGGTGKTPVTIWLARHLAGRGFSPGIVSRGYGGSRSSTSMRVDSASDPDVVGDEPVLLAKRTECPVVVDADRTRAVRMLVDDGADVIIADDGLQHYRLERDYEICVIDGARGLGNGMLLPAGPLRESTARLSEVDRVLVNGAGGEPGNIPALEKAPVQFDLVAVEASRLDGSLKRALDSFAGTTVHAVAAIGNPGRFFEMLQSYGIQVIEHPFRDHAALSRQDLEFGDDFDVLMTEKDAVKVKASVSDKYWSVPVELTLDPAIAGPWLEQIECRIRSSVENR